MSDEQHAILRWITYQYDDVNNPYADSTNGCAISSISDDVMQSDDVSTDSNDKLASDDVNCNQFIVDDVIVTNDWTAHQGNSSLESSN